MSLHTLAVSATTVVILATGVLGGAVGSVMNDDTAQAANLASFEARLSASHARADLGSTVSANRITSTFTPTVDAARALLASSDGKATTSRDALVAALSTYETAIATQTEDGFARLTTAKAAVAAATPAITDASTAVSAEVVAFDAAVAAQAEANRVAAEAAAEETARTNTADNADSSEGATSNPEDGGSSDGTSSSSSNSGGGFDAASVVASYGCSYAETSSGVSHGGGSPSRGCWVEIDTSLSGDRLFMTVYHELAHGLMMSQSEACHYAQADAGKEDAANWYTSTHFGFTVPQYGYPSDTSGLEANCH